MDQAVFLKHLKRSRLLAAPELAEATQQLAHCATGIQAAQALIERQLLTPFQAQQLLAGQPRGLVLGQYRMLQEIGRGGMGTVYQALHGVMGRIVAVKVISPERVRDARLLAMFRREVQAATLLHHPHIVMAYDANEADGMHYLVLEYIPGSDLHTLIRRHGPLPAALALAWLQQTAEALRYAHSLGMVHRDIKPANLLVSGPDGADFLPDDPAAVHRTTIKVLDFGLARLQLPTGDTIGVPTGHGGVFGTPDFIAPEQANNVHAVDIRSDLYSLGCTFYFALSGQVPFPAGSALEKIFCHAFEAPRPLEELRPDLPLPVSALIARLMEKNPDHRYESPADLLQALAGLTAPSRLQNGSTAAELAAVHPSSSAQAHLSPMEATASDGGPATPESHRASHATALAWRRWVGLVEAVAAGRCHRLNYSKAEYARLHGELLADCRARLAMAGEADPVVVASLYERISPWLTLESLARAEPEILQDLVRYCRTVGPQVWGRPGDRPGRDALLLAGSVLLATAAAVYWTWPRLRRQLFPSLESWRDSLQVSIANNLVWWASFLGATLLVVALYLVVRVPRR